MRNSDFEPAERLKLSRGKESFRILKRRLVFQGRILKLEVLDVRSRSGIRFERTLIQHRGAVVVIPRLPEGRLILIRQLRVATGGWIWEFPAGTLERGESPRACARRELQEETAWKAGRLRKALEFYPTPGISTERMHLFVADRLEQVGSPGRDADEELEVEAFSVSRVEQMIRRGKIVDGKTILGFLFFRNYIL